MTGAFVHTQFDTSGYSMMWLFASTTSVKMSLYCKLDPLRKIFIELWKNRPSTISKDGTMYFIALNIFIMPSIVLKVAPTEIAADNFY